MSGRHHGLRNKSADPLLGPLIKTVRTTHPTADVPLIEYGYEVAARMHAGQSRRSGDPYIPPLAVATILADLERRCRFGPLRTRTQKIAGDGYRRDPIDGSGTGTHTRFCRELHVRAFAAESPAGLRTIIVRLPGRHGGRQY